MVGKWNILEQYLKQPLIPELAISSQEGWSLWVKGRTEVWWEIYEWGRAMFNQDTN